MLQFNLSGRFDLNAFDNSFGRNHTRIDVRIRHEVRILDEGFDERHNQLRDRGVVRLKFQRLPSKEKIPLWIYVASALLALILFAILVVSLIKVRRSLFVTFSNKHDSLNKFVICLRCFYSSFSFFSSVLFWKNRLAFLSETNVKKWKSWWNKWIRIELCNLLQVLTIDRKHVCHFF